MNKKIRAYSTEFKTEAEKGYVNLSFEINSKEGFEVVKESYPLELSDANNSQQGNVQNEYTYDVCSIDQGVYAKI